MASTVNGYVTAATDGRDARQILRLLFVQRLGRPIPLAMTISISSDIVLSSKLSSFTVKIVSGTKATSCFSRYRIFIMFFKSLYILKIFKIYKLSLMLFLRKFDKYIKHRYICYIRMSKVNWWNNKTISIAGNLWKPGIHTLSNKTIDTNSWYKASVQSHSKIGNVANYENKEIKEFNITRKIKMNPTKEQRDKLTEWWHA